MPLDHRVAIITGATGATGSLAARALAGQGASLVLIGTDRLRLDTLASGLGLPPERILALPADMTDSAAVFEAAQTVQARFGRADILLHLVGGWTGGKSLVETLPEELESMLRQHLWTTFYLTRAFLPLLIDNGWGRVIVVSSPTAVDPPARHGAYAIGKAAQETLLLTLAKEVAPHGVTANILQVRSIDAKNEGKGTRPEEIVTAILELCSDAAANTNGRRIPLYTAPS